MRCLIERRCQLTCKGLEAAGPGGDEWRHSSVGRLCANAWAAPDSAPARL